MGSMKKWSSTTIVTQSPGNIVSDMAGEKVMMSIENSKYYNLGEIGGYIWDLIKLPVLMEEVIARLTAEYEISKQECELQVFAFMESLVNEGLVQIKG